MKTEIRAITVSFCIALTLSARNYDPFGEISKGTENSTLNMHLAPEGPYQIGNDQWGTIIRVNMLKIKNWSSVPCIKKAWIMKGYEGEDGMAFHPVISEVKDVNADGTPDIFRCRSEHEGARIERLRYSDGGVVWESEPMAALHGDESRLPVFDLDGDGVYSVLHATRSGTWCVSAKTGVTEWSVREAAGDIIVGHFLDGRKQAVIVRSGGILRCYDHTGTRQWMHDTGLKGGAAYAHEAYRYDADGDGLDEIFINWQKLTMALKGDGTVLWKDTTQRHHSDYLACGDVDADGRTELVYDHEGCGAEKGPAYIVDAMTGALKLTIDYRKSGLRHAQNMALGDFIPAEPGLEIALCGKRGHIFVWNAGGKLLWKRAVPASLLSKGDWDGDGVEDISCYALGANVDGMFSVWNGEGQRLYALSFLPSPSVRTWSDKHNGGSWSHAMPGGHEGIRRQADLDGNGCVDVIMPFGAWHWGSDSILFLLEGPWRPQLDQYNVIWTSQSKNSSESMPVGGHDIGLNVWVENNELLFYIGRAGYRDENGALLKAGRVRVRLTPNPFEDGTFRQELKLREGYVEIRAEGSKTGSTAVRLWVEVDRPINEFWQIYQLPVAAIPTNRPCRRKKHCSVIYATEDEKWKQLVNTIREIHETGSPVLVGTRTVSSSERLSKLLWEQDLHHRVLNAVKHEEEAHIVARAGLKGRITVATNMAGRGTDIKLGEEVAELGGLHVIAAEPNESARIDRQLFGRGARQGDPGGAQLVVSLEDEIVSRYAERLSGIMKKRLEKKTGKGTRAFVIRALVYMAQKRAEKLALRRRKSVLQTDHWLDEQLGFAGVE